ncbi:MAG: aminotransferase, partial [Gammaproteobacteria bacterium]
MDPAHWTSRNVRAMQVSAIKEMAMRGAAVPGVASLTWGLPSFRTPEHIRRGLAQAMELDLDIGKYALPAGLPELREQVVRTHA